MRSFMRNSSREVSAISCLGGIVVCVGRDSLAKENVCGRLTVWLDSLSVLDSQMT